MQIPWGEKRCGLITLPVSKVKVRRAGVSFAGLPELPGLCQAANGTESLELDVAGEYQSSFRRELDAVHEATIRHAGSQGVEKGRKDRIDSTVVETNVHLPIDSTLLQDGIRIIMRWLAEGQEFSPRPGYIFADHNRRAKKRCLEILHAKKAKVREGGVSRPFEPGESGSGLCVDGYSDSQWLSARGSGGMSAGAGSGQEAGGSGWDSHPGDWADGASGVERGGSSCRGEIGLVF